MVGLIKIENLSKALGGTSDRCFDARKLESEAGKKYLNNIVYLSKNYSVTEVLSLEVHTRRTEIPGYASKKILWCADLV